MKTILTLSLLTLLAACGKDGKNGVDGSNGATILGIDGVSTGIDFEDIDAGLVCGNGGISVFTFRDTNSDGTFQAEESIIKVKAICHGLNGQDGVDGMDGQNGLNGQDGADGQDGMNATVTLETIQASNSCPTGGIKIYASGSAPVEVCNGINGLNGEQGLPGVQGIPGLNGSNGVDGQDGINGQDGMDGRDGTQVLPVKFCVDDKSTFPEYGLMIGEELFAVYWGTTPASPNTAQAFLTKLVPGQYRSTGGNNCLFKI